MTSRTFIGMAESYHASGDQTAGNWLLNANQVESATNALDERSSLAHYVVKRHVAGKHM
jgi:hypothetical protein